MPCSQCSRDGHNAATCPEARRCTACGDLGHYAPTCPNTKRCSQCGEAGHNVATCAAARRCTRCGSVGHYAPTCSIPSPDHGCSFCGAHGHDRRTCPKDVSLGDASDKLLEKIEDVPIPRGRRFEYLDRAEGWLSRELTVFAWKDAAYELLRALPSYQSLRPAFKTLVTAVHKASNYTLYIGRSGAHPDHLRQRFESHRTHRGAQFIRPVLRVPTGFARKNGWETVAIRWMKRKDGEGVLCCNNTAADHRGRWPDTPDTVIYVAACRPRKS